MTSIVSPPGQNSDLFSNTQGLPETADIVPIEATTEPLVVDNYDVIEGSSTANLDDIFR